MELLFIRNYVNPNSVSTYTGGVLIPALIDHSIGNISCMYVLSEASNYYPQGVPANRKKFENALMDFFPTTFLNHFAKANGKIKYNDLPKLVKAYEASK